MRVASTLRAAGDTHPGLLRKTNEDRFHYDADRGVFVVIDGVGGQAAGERAADTALAQVRQRLERGNGLAETRVREAIGGANAEIYRLASLKPEWKGMACVLTVAVLDGTDVVIGHVGDTRMYKLRRGRIDKLTRDHSPVGEREDAGELSEAEAMRHPRRNEVYRDVGSEPHDAADPEFVDVLRVPFEPDSALLLCTDGLTDTVPAGRIRTIVEDYAGHAYEIVRALIEAANEAGGKDNVTAVYVEGPRFIEGEETRDLTRVRSGANGAAGPSDTVAAGAAVSSPAIAATEEVEHRSSRGRLILLLLLLAATIALAAYAMRDQWGRFLPPWAAVGPQAIVVKPGESISAAVATARPGTEVVVEPGEYRERVVMAAGVRVRSSESRAASIRLPVGASEGDAAIVALDIAGAELEGFRIVGDAATPLGTGVSLRNAGLRIVNVEITGAQYAAVDFGGGTGELLASDVHDNPGMALMVRAGGAPRVAHSMFARNATAGRSAGPIVVEAGGRVDLRANVFHGTPRDALVIPGPVPVPPDNVFVPAPERPAATPRGGQRRR